VKPKKKQIIAAAVLVVVLAVSAYDAYRCVVDQAILASVEINPICAWLIKLDAGRVAILIGVKTFGTGVVAAFIASCIALKKWVWTWAGIVALVLTQAMVMACYGMFGA